MLSLKRAMEVQRMMEQTSYVPSIFPPEDQTFTRVYFHIRQLDLDDWFLKVYRGFADDGWQANKIVVVREIQEHEQEVHVWGVDNFDASIEELKKFYKETRLSEIEIRKCVVR